MIAELLSTGRENKRSAEELLSVLGIEKRDFYQALRTERRNGHFILSEKDNSGGYWLWDGKDLGELKRYYQMQRSGAIDTLATLKPVYRELKRREEEEKNGQESESDTVK